MEAPESLCGALHPNVPLLTCALAPGNNATTDPTYELDENGYPLLVNGQYNIIIPGHGVHVHGGLAWNDEKHRWEDVPE